MITLDNWNEFGEGHYFMPSNMDGFGYLEAVGKVFGEPEHTDVIPRDTARLGRLFDANRTATAREGDVYKHGSELWSFNTTDNTEGFTVGKHLLSFRQASDTQAAFLYGAVSETDLKSILKKYTDPYYYSPANLNIPINDNSGIMISYRNKSESTTTKLYYITNTGTASVDVTLTPNHKYDSMLLSLDILQPLLNSNSIE